MNIASLIADRSAADIVSCNVDTLVSEAVSILANQRIGALPVMRAGAVAGIVSERDIVYRLASMGSDCLDGPVEAIMTSPVITVEPSTTVDEALVDNGALCAFISIGDLVKTRIDEVEHEAEALRSYIQTV